MSLTKDHIIDSVQNHLNLPKYRSAELVDSLLEIIKKTLESGEDVLITGFGKFCVRDKAKRKGRNPATGRKLMLRTRRVVRFRCSGRLKGRVNG